MCLAYFAGRIASSSSSDNFWTELPLINSPDVAVEMASVSSVPSWSDACSLISGELSAVIC